jgi:hypothetical protein
MRFIFGERLKSVAAASILSCLIAGVVCVLTSPVNSAVGVTISVIRDAKGDRLPLVPIIQPIRNNSNSNEKPTSRQTLLGCEPAFSPFAHPAQAQIFTHCTA